MLLTINTTHRPATDLGFLLHKHPDKCQTFSLSYGVAHVFYPEATPESCTACMLLDIDPIGLVRERRRSESDGTLAQYVNDRPYVASSFLSVAIAQVLSSALKGTCAAKPELAQSDMPLEFSISVLPCRDGGRFLRRLFEPLGYTVTASRVPLDETFSEWGDSPYFRVILSKSGRLSDCLTHLYVLLPVLDNNKHYWVGRDELEKLLARGEGWLSQHPEREEIVKRYLKYQRRLAREAIERLLADDIDPDATEEAKEEEEQALEKKLTLNDQRLETIITVLKEAGAKRVIDLGCGEGRLVGRLLQDKAFTKIVGVDVSYRALEIAGARLKRDRLPDRQRERIELFQGSLTYRDGRFSGFDAVCAIEVIEHIDASRLRAFERVIFAFARPQTVVVTTPNVEYNVRFETLAAGSLRHRDHRFEWTCREFEAWATRVATEHGYSVRFLPVGPVDPQVGAPTQMGVFSQ